MMKRIHQMQVRDQRGFTLIELLIVVAIIAILAAIAIPQYSKYRENAALGKIQSNAKNCLNLHIAHLTDLLQNPNATAPTMPAGCTASGTQTTGYSCTCSDPAGITSKTCTATEGGSVTCS